jgi:hypothetical protein
METTIMENIVNTDSALNIFTESFICEGNLYNASYIPTDDSTATIMLEKVIKYPEEKIYYKYKINMVVITVVNSSKIRLDCQLEEECYEMALAAATAAYKLNLVKNYLTVEIMDQSFPIHIQSSNR